MNPHARDIARSLESVSKALAEWTVSAQFDADTTLPLRYGDGARRRWVADTQSRIAHLAGALAVRCPELFADSVRWMRDAFAARGTNQADLSLNLRSLRDVIAAELPVAVTEAALPFIEQAMAAMSADSSTGGADHRHPGDDEHDALVQEFLELMLAGRVSESQQLVLDAAQRGADVRALHARVLQPAMREVGRRWQADIIGVADEHAATAITQATLSRLRTYFPAVPRRGRRVVATAVPGDLHDLGVRIVADAFEIDGWDVLYLGANMPGADLVSTLIERDAHLVALSATSVVHLISMGETIDAIRAAPGCDRVRVLAGGPPFLVAPSLWKELGADGSASSAVEAVDIGNRLVDGQAARV